jgi:hypothetical protein
MTRQAARFDTPYQRSKHPKGRRAAPQEFCSGGAIQPGQRNIKSGHPAYRETSEKLRAPSAIAGTGSRSHQDRRLDHVGARPCLSASSGAALRSRCSAHLRWRGLSPTRTHSDDNLVVFGSRPCTARRRARLPSCASTVLAIGRACRCSGAASCPQTSIRFGSRPRIAVFAMTMMRIICEVPFEAGLSNRFAALHQFNSF